jgi:hypothetical protein
MRSAAAVGGAARQGVSGVPGAGVKVGYVGKVRRWLPPVALLAALIIISAIAPDPVAGSSPATPELVVRSANTIRPVNRDLSGFHVRNSAASIASDFDGLGATSFRHVMSDYDFLDFDCATKKISPASIEYFGSWIDAVTAEGARPILSLSYVPPCFARNGQPKGPPKPDAIDDYRSFLDDLFAGLVTDRVAAGREPMRWFELWNEPDIGLDPGNTSTGHGYVGTLDEYVERNLPSLVGAIQQAESDSGVDLHIGTPATYAPWSFASVYGDLATMLERANGFDRATAEQSAASIIAYLGPVRSVALMEDGGFRWPRRIADEAAALGLKVDFASVHYYPNTPLLGLDFPEPKGPVLMKGRNPDASPDAYRALAERWSAEFRDQELVLSEWGLTASGADARSGTCETAAFDAASLSVMQDSAIDRALYLGRPGGVEDAPFRAWSALPNDQVAVDQSGGLAGVWSTAASGAGRTTLLLSQWHSKLTDAEDLSVPVVVEGLPEGTYHVTVETIGQGTSPAASSVERVVSSHGGRLEIAEPLALRGQAFVRVDVRATGVEPLPALTNADPSGDAHTCLVSVPPSPTTTTTVPAAGPPPSPTTTTTAPAAGPPPPSSSTTTVPSARPAPPIAAEPAFAG